MNRASANRSSISSLVTLVLLICVPGGALNAAESAGLSPQEVAEQAGDAVVLIEAERDGSRSQGTGFFVDDQGVIVTCLHVIDGATSLSVSLRDGERIEDVAVRAFDVQTDLALLGVEISEERTSVTAIELGDVASLVPGSRILVISNPLGFEHTMTEGIFSAWRKPTDAAPNDRRVSQSPVLTLPPKGLLQISASISPGSSGGPVLNDQAQAIGIATSGVLWGMAGLNFAVSTDEVAVLLEQDDAMDLETFRERLDDARREIARPHFEDGKMAYENGETLEAAQCLDRALQLFPGYLEALLLSGRLALESGQVESAMQKLTRAIEIDDYDAEAWYLSGEAHQAMALSSGEMSGLARAETAFERALELDPRHGKAAFNLALFRIRRDELDQAAQLLVNAAENEPGFVDAYYMLGEVRHRQGMINDARDAFEQALWEDDTHAMSHFGLARLYMERDRAPNGLISPHGRAADHWEEFLRLSEGDPSLAEQREFAILLIRQYMPHLLD